MNNLEIEKKWRKKWEETGLYKSDPSFQISGLS